MADLQKETVDYSADLSSDMPSERVRMGLVAGSAQIAAENLYDLLRRRLLILTSIVACGFLAGVGVDLLLRVVSPLPPDHDQSPSEWLLASWRVLLNLAVAGIATLVLWRRPPGSVQGLRVIEVLVIGTLTVMSLSLRVDPYPYGHLERAASEPFDIRQALVDVTQDLFAAHLVHITIYGTLIPNTWRRCATIVGVLAVFHLPSFPRTPSGSGRSIAIALRFS